jgi:hypothetical protein
VKKVIVVLALLVVAATAQAAYVVMLKNGSRVVARDRYQLKGSNVVVTLRNGTLTSIPLAHVDLEATEKLNAQNLGDATPMEWVDAARPTPIPTPTPSVASLGRIIPGLARPENDAARPTPTPGISLRDVEYPDKQVERTFEEGLERYHLYLYRTSMGSQPRYLFVEVRVNGQTEVVKALQAITSTYNVLAESAPDRAPERVELQMLNESGKEAGLFRLSPEDAAELATAKTTAEEFFIRKVIF